MLRSTFFSGVFLTLGVRALNLAKDPSCGTMSSDTAVDVNAGIDLSKITTVVAFGDGYTSIDIADGGDSASAPEQSGTDPKAGGRFTNGRVWVEYFASNISATLKDYAVPKTVVSNDLYAKADLSDTRDFLTQSSLFMAQKGRPESDSTLVVLYEGMEDFQRAEVDLADAADNVVFQILKLTSSPFFGKNFLIVDSYGRGNTSDAGEAWKTEIWKGARTAYNTEDISLAFVDMGGLITSMVSSPADFGFENVGPCTVSEDTIEGQCSNPNTTVFYIDNYPSTATHSLMSEYALKVLNDCVI
ncbi:carbohydrate esterase family 16 protein [Cylindrobasidium torrendii FP15055 ss-10]|uniref:Carbohydrate esterase family 16 protein n=1 Tax=Cylindrobasidium torrendii FP15055 ss-10 TaxID=1314674 RepID=A0A0D7BSY9_9AGAR|nr:carbohydrate esterase family 16 protein [Cylindrobasidium torrendii FP15055 ss-10]